MTFVQIGTAIVIALGIIIWKVKSKRVRVASGVLMFVVFWLMGMAP